MYMQARYYDPVIGRFYSNDPVDALGHLSTPNGIHGFNRYAYANNNPYRYTDPDGRKANQLFDTKLEAAKDFGKTYNDDSIRNNKEYGATIYSVTTKGENKFTLYAYNVPRQGDKDSVVVNSKLKSGQKEVTTIHSHSSGEGYENPSSGDLELLSDGQSAYVTTPDGKLVEYDSTGKETIRSTALPNQNDGSAKTNPKDDPYIE